MIAIGVCLGVAALAWWAGPRLLTMGHWQVRHPRLALAAWHAALGTGALAAAASIATAVLATLSAGDASDGASAVIQTVVGWGALGALGAALLVVGAGSDALVGAGRRTYGDILTLPHSAEPLDRRTSLRTCRSDDVFACSIPGEERAVVVSTAMREVLTPAQLRAVVEHERAHLRGNHYIALRLAELNCACLPSLRSAKKLLRATTLLVELIADDAAARRAGAVHLANALVVVAARTGDVSMEIRAERLAERTWAPARTLTAASPALTS
ncbi:M48 family metalloprotease [Microbacterium sp. RU33B]|uniref:M48 family metalloprotease n=1 Tax=Microbacterium sp. RU33B TaxID=1907390 RepID=UPI00095B2AED|nr:M48 family metalloprotease [Microbacterium sp. RU33B]SIT72286.1 Peptidase family M48 [Microbacterium sp. RU33B]